MASEDGVSGKALVDPVAGAAHKYFRCGWNCLHFQTKIASHKPLSSSLYIVGNFDFLGAGSDPFFSISLKV